MLTSLGPVQACPPPPPFETVPLRRSPANKKKQQKKTEKQQQKNNKQRSRNCHHHYNLRASLYSIHSRDAERGGRGLCLTRCWERRSQVAADGVGYLGARRALDGVHTHTHKSWNCRWPTIWVEKKRKKRKKKQQKQTKNKSPTAKKKGRRKKENRMGKKEKKKKKKKPHGIHHRGTRQSPSAPVNNPLLLHRCCCTPQYAHASHTHTPHHTTHRAPCTYPHLRATAVPLLVPPARAN